MAGNLLPHPTFARPWPYEEIGANTQSDGTYMGDARRITDSLWTGANATRSTWGTSGRNFPTPPYHTASAVCKAREETRAGHNLCGKWYGSSVDGSWRTASGMLHAPPDSRSRAPAQERVRGQPLAGPLHKQLQRLSQSKCHQLQTILHAVAQQLCSLPERRALASWLGQQLDAWAGQWLKEQRFRLVTVLKHHADDFFLIQEPSNVIVIYLQKTADKAFMYADQMLTNISSVWL
eukprot:TRINITY_DN9763_c0_g3_i1.p1 TRINITY_DN9763_c0_g3~~TRINITY_DN9763_c0_g3_i1.p1  ORF type:complete len:235 (-),score=27.76 TRINITY_DN9763_c0_g3_i1:74-778(-)